jgi:hypothetical protein
MDVMDEGLIEFWRALNKHNVQYIMVGGFAMKRNGDIRVKEVSDIWINDTLENRKNFRFAYADLGNGDFASFETMQFVPGWTQLDIVDGFPLHITTYMKGLEDQSFEACRSRASEADFNGLEVPFLHLNDLLANKKAVGRPKDQLDVLELEKIKKYLDEKAKE